MLPIMSQLISRYGDDAVSRTTQAIESQGFPRYIIAAMRSCSTYEEISGRAHVPMEFVHGQVHRAIDKLCDALEYTKCPDIPLEELFSDVAIPRALRTRNGCKTLRDVAFLLYTKGPVKFNRIGESSADQICEKLNAHGLPAVRLGMPGSEIMLAEPGELIFKASPNLRRHLYRHGIVTYAQLVDEMERCGYFTCKNYSGEFRQEVIRLLAEHGIPAVECMYGVKLSDEHMSFEEAFANLSMLSQFNRLCRLTGMSVEDALASVNKAVLDGMREE